MQSARRVGQIASPEDIEPAMPWHKLLISSRDPHPSFAAQRLLCPRSTHASPPARNTVMDLSVWIPITVALGLATLGLMFLFVIACEKV